MCIFAYFLRHYMFFFSVFSNGKISFFFHLQLNNANSPNEKRKSETFDGEEPSDIEQLKHQLSVERKLRHDTERELNAQVSSFFQINEHLSNEDDLYNRFSIDLYQSRNGSSDEIIREGHPRKTRYHYFIKKAIRGYQNNKFGNV